MSIHALKWAVETTAPSAAAKLVLICMANFADERGQCWPTVAKLVIDTQLSDTAVRDNLRLLMDSNLIRESAGTTSSKRVFTLLLPSA